jgi:hypothetical protein
MVRGSKNMGITWIINGVAVYILSTLVKFIFSSDNSKGLRTLFHAVLITLKKGDPTAAGSACQLFGLFWLLIGIAENIWRNNLKNLSGPVLFAGELFIPTILMFVAVKIFYR